jgi:hypothetical protein
MYFDLNQNPKNAEGAMCHLERERGKKIKRVRTEHGNIEIIEHAIC